LHLTDQTESLRTADAVRMRVENLKKVFRTGKQELVLFENLSFCVQQSEMLAIVGESGSGKSTLLHILGALDRPTAGDVYFGKTSLMSLDDEAAADFRGREIGFVWQFHYLLPEFSALENAAMPLLMARKSSSSQKKLALEKAAEWLRAVGLLDRAEHRPGELSGGEQQRVALARALIAGPKMLMADEPTVDLDNRSAEMVFDLITRLHHEHGLTSVIVTHNLEFARRCGRVLRLQAGRLQAVTPSSLLENRS
jgi:lipoprotein-releasing system ATP-binding protein